VSELEGDGRLPGPGDSVEPEHVFVFLVVSPAFKLGEDVSPGPLRAPLPIPAEIPGVWSMIHPPEKCEVCVALLAGYYT